MAPGHEIGREQKNGPLSASHFAVLSYDVGRWGRLNYDHHKALYSAAGRRFTDEILQRANLQSDRYVRMHLSVMEQREPAKKDHKDLLDMARARNTEDACALLTKHIQRTKD